MRDHFLYTSQPYGVIKSKKFHKILPPGMYKREKIWYTYSIPVHSLFLCAYTGAHDKL